MSTIKIVKESCHGCPMIWDVILPNGQKGYIKYRWGNISLKPITETCGLFQEPIVSDQIGDAFDGILSLEKAIRWLESKGYNVVNKIGRLEFDF